MIPMQFHLPLSLELDLVPGIIADASDLLSSKGYTTLKLGIVLGGSSSSSSTIFFPFLILSSYEGVDDVVSVVAVCSTLVTIRVD
ncbi:hypothetical protein L1987_26667 [Smallanthus sonchifolius]|uniref:Uncharacterized protein n=1 Tax=Smallanthus sonchifolius TaxID=185202 RepID=A0ACB9IA24_9ASTR|nr:hypothetical protein L1987_26667 [Smallanthus sonchifolius]